jgi:hypothetical protein
LGYKRGINHHPVHHRPVMNLHAADLIPLQELPSAPSLLDKNCGAHGTGTIIGTVIDVNGTKRLA